MPEHQREITDSAKEEMEVLAAEFVDPFDQVTAETTGQPLLILDEPKEPPKKHLPKEGTAAYVPVYRERPEGRCEDANSFLERLSKREDELQNQPIKAVTYQDPIPTLGDIAIGFPGQVQGVIDRALFRRKLSNNLAKVGEMTVEELCEIPGMGVKTARQLLDKVHQELTKNSTTSPSLRR